MIDTEYAYDEGGRLTSILAGGILRQGPVPRHTEMKDSLARLIKAQLGLDHDESAP